MSPMVGQGPPYVMPSYRFCRPDDVPLLVRAVNECYNPHFPGTPPMSVEGFRREMKQLDLWPSSCLVAADDERPIAVLTGAKREAETLVSRIGVRPGETGKGHGGHLLTSLSQKLAVLGPPRLVAEVPGDLPDAPGVERFFERLGWRREAGFTDWRREPEAGAVAPVPEGLAAPVTVDELAAAGALAQLDRATPAPAWSRSRRTLLNRRERLRGLAVASPDRIEAWVVFEPDGEPRGPGDLPAEALGPAPAGELGPGPAGELGPGPAGELGPGPAGALGPGSAVEIGPGPAGEIGPAPVEGPGPGSVEESAGGTQSRPVEVVGSWAAARDRRELLLGALLRSVIAAAGARPVRLARLAPGELPEALLAGLGFAPERGYHRYAAEAKPL